MENELLNHFYSSLYVVSITELTNTKQWDEEPVINYMNHWRAVSLKYRDHLFKSYAVEMHVQGMEWDISISHFFLQKTNFASLQKRHEF